MIGFNFFLVLWIEKINKPYKNVNQDDTFLICYTSGTMDNPKGAMVTNRSLTLATNVIYTIGYHLSGVDIILSFLLLAHIMEQLIFTECLLYGTRTGFYTGKINLGDDSSKIKGKPHKMQKKKILILVDFI